MDGINRVPGVKKTLGIRSKIIGRSAYRQQYAGINAADGKEPKIESVAPTLRAQKYKDNAGILAKKLDRILDYKEEYRQYYHLEQDLEGHYDLPEEDMDFIDHLYVVLTDMNDVILALHNFDKAFDTTYSQVVGILIKKREDALAQASVLVHVDYTLGFFKGRMKRIYESHPEYFDFFVENQGGLIPELIDAFRRIKAIIPEKIEDISLAQDKTGAVIDHKL